MSGPRLDVGRWATQGAVVQFLAHTFFFGSVLGFYLDRVFTARPVIAGSPGREQ